MNLSFCFFFRSYSLSIFFSCSSCCTHTHIERMMMFQLYHNNHDDDDNMTNYFSKNENSYVSLNLLWHEFFLFRFVFHQNFILLFHFHFGGYYFRSNWFNMVFGVYIYKFSVSVGFFFFVVGLVNRDKKQVGHLKMTIFFCSSSGEVFFFFCLKTKQRNQNCIVCSCVCQV